MQICLPHYDRLKTAIKVRGLWDMVGGPKPEMVEKFEASIEGVEKVEHFDPLLAANNMIWSVGMKCFGLGLMQPDEHGNHRCPVRKARRDGLDREGCDRSRAHRPGLQKVERMQAADPAQSIDVSDNESEVLRLLRRGRVGSAHVRPYKGLYWEIDFSFPGGLKCGRQRFYRRSPTAAYRFAIQKTKEFREHGILAGKLTSGQRWVAADCFRRLAEIHGDDPAVLLNVVSEHLDRHPKAGNARTIDQVRIEIVAKKRRGERRERYVRDFDYKMRCLVEALGNVPISSVTTVMLEKELARHPEWASGTVHSVVQAWKVLFNYAVKYGYALKNPCVCLELPRKRKAKPEVLSALQVHRLLAACITDPIMEQCLAYVAIGCFTGIRPEEMQRLRWEMFNFDAGLITIDGKDSKCGERGIVKMSANLISWIRPVAKASGPVLRAQVAKLRALCRECLGLTRWPHDCMRHSFASYHYTEFRDIGEVCSQLRHGTGQIVFINHYYVVRSPAEARYFWRIVRPVALLTA